MHKTRDSLDAVTRIAGQRVAAAGMGRSDRGAGHRLTIGIVDVARKGDPLLRFDQHRLHANGEFEREIVEVTLPAIGPDALAVPLVDALGRPPASQRAMKVDGHSAEHFAFALPDVELELAGQHAINDDLALGVGDA